ncbi:MAG: DNA translocase FtsK [Candidatus Nomurabacteria bacterium]|nr:DNA translocase FtsK [Candidatus Nomurabacteria bacterium]
MAKKKRGPGRPPKNSKSAKSQHSVPHGFWRQVGAIFLIVIALIIAIGLFNVGGTFPVVLANAVRWIIGWAAYIVPVILLWQAIQIFRREDNRLPGIIWFATILFLICLAGLFQLMLENPTNQAVAFAGNGGGVFGLGVVEMLLQILNVPVTVMILVVFMIILLFFVLSISPKKIIVAIIEFFRREDEAEANNAKVAKKMALVKEDVAQEPVKLKLNKGVETVDFSKEHDEKSRDRTEPKEEVTALTTASDPNWRFPSLDLLSKRQRPADPGDVEHNAKIIHDTLAEFNINVEMEGANIGPKVTQYTLRPPSGVKLSRITALDSSLALNLAAPTLRIEAPIPGKRSVGIEVPNVKPADVRLRAILDSDAWREAREPLSFAIGLDISGEPIIGELNKMPHLVIAGQTGSGKSVMINSLICSLLYRNTPADMKLILVDPKQVEMTPYNDIPHLLTPVITEPEKTISALKWAVSEMERRYSLLHDERVRDIKSYNQKQTGEAMPYIVIVVDEMADLMMMAKREVEALVVRLAQKARAVGVHLVLATQRPSVDVITGLIKANVPARIAFTVAQQVDSRTILDQIGAEKLLGSGDMLLLTPSMSKPKRIQSAFLSDDEVMKIADYLRMERPPEYNADIISQQVQFNDRGSVIMDFDGAGDDEYRDAVRVVIEAGKASTSLLQRRLRIGYSKAARIMEEMEENGIIGPQDGSRPRDVLVSSLDELGG